MDGIFTGVLVEAGYRFGEILAKRTGKIKEKIKLNALFCDFFLKEASYEL